MKKKRQKTDIFGCELSFMKAVEVATDGMERRASPCIMTLLINGAVRNICYASKACHGCKNYCRRENITARLRKERGL